MTAPRGSVKVTAPVAASIVTLNFAVAMVVAVAVLAVVNGVVTQALGATARLGLVKKAASLANDTRTTLSAQISIFRRPPPTVMIGIMLLVVLPPSPAPTAEPPIPDGPPSPGVPRLFEVHAGAASKRPRTTPSPGIEPAHPGRRAARL